MSSGNGIQRCWLCNFDPQDDPQKFKRMQAAGKWPNLYEYDARTYEYFFSCARCGFSVTREEVQRDGTPIRDTPWDANANLTVFWREETVFPTDGQQVIKTPEAYKAWQARLAGTPDQEYEAKRQAERDAIHAEFETEKTK